MTKQDFEYFRLQSQVLESLYDEYNRPEYIHPDPLAPVLKYKNPADQEVVALIAASLAFGNVKQILGSIQRVLDILPHPAVSLLSIRPNTFRKRLVGFRHRYTGEKEMLDLLLGIQRVLKRHGSLGTCFVGYATKSDENVLPALGHFVSELREEGGANYLLPDPARGSACKRLMMYLRWMLRKDSVDPGCWCDIAPNLLHAGMLIVPIDTHMHRIAKRLGFTSRNAANLRTAIEVTDALRQFCPDDPVRYDFALTRLGIRTDTDLEAFVSTWPMRRAGE